MVQQTIISFLKGELDIISFRKIFDETDDISNYLQAIVDNMKANHVQPTPFMINIFGRESPTLDVMPFLLSPDKDEGVNYGCPPRFTSVKQCLTYEFNMITHNVETATGALRFYCEVYEIYYQTDKSVDFCYKYSDEFGFALDVIPQYLLGGEAEMYIQKHIIPNVSDKLKKSERRKIIRTMIKEAFKSEKGYPHWVQCSEWPIGKDGMPTTYIGKGKSEGDMQRYRFRDESNGEVIIIEQFY